MAIDNPKEKTRKLRTKKRCPKFIYRANGAQLQVGGKGCENIVHKMYETGTKQKTKNIQDIVLALS